MTIERHQAVQYCYSDIQKLQIWRNFPYCRIWWPASDREDSFCHKSFLLKNTQNTQNQGDSEYP